MSHEQENHNNITFGFWLYIMSDCLLFAGLFATYIVLQHNTFGGPSMKEIISMPYVLVETLILLTSSFTFGLAMMAAHQLKKQRTLLFLGLTGLLGATFIGMELHEFCTLLAEGHSWAKSGFLTAFFSLVGTHGLHVSFGLLWLIVMMIQVARKPMTGSLKTTLTCLGLFWHFLDIVWIFVFSIVYLMGAI